MDDDDNEAEKDDNDHHLYADNYNQKKNAKVRSNA